MKTKTFKIISIGRKYYAATTNGSKCKLTIAGLEKLIVGQEIDVLVKDISVRSKYGTDLIFQAECAVTSSDIISLRHKSYNSLLVDRCRELGGRWDKELSAWIFSSFVADEVEKLDLMFNSKLITVEITALENCSKTVDFLGYSLAVYTSQHPNDVKIADNVALISGTVKLSYGRITFSEGSVLRLQVPEFVLEHYISREVDSFSYKIIDEKIIKITDDYVKCDCGCFEKKICVMGASMGSSCMDCYDRMSN